MSQQLSVLSVIINNETVAIIPNSLKYKGGRGEIKTISTNAGNNSVETVHSVDAETMLSSVSFDLPVTSDNNSKVIGWKSRVGTNSISLSQKISVQGGTQYVTLAFDEMSLNNDPEFEATADGKVTVEWSGAPMSAI